MTWARFDDRYDDGRKIRRAWRRNPRAVGLHAMAVTYCCRHETDGVLEPDWIEDRIPKEREREKALAVLLDVGLLELLPLGQTRDVRDHRGVHVTLGPFTEEVYVVHDFLDYNDSSVGVAAKREQDAERKRKARTNGVLPDDPDPSERSPTGLQAESADRNAESIAPVPSRPVPSSLRSEERPTSTAEPGKHHLPEVEALCHLLSQLTRQRTETPDGSPKHRVTGQWRTDMDRLLRIDGRPPDEVEAAIRWIDRHPFWSSNILSPGKLRQQFDQIRLQAARPPPAQTADEARRERTRRRLSIAEPTEPEAA